MEHVTFVLLLCIDFKDCFERMELGLDVAWFDEEIGSIVEWGNLSVFGGSIC